MVPARFVRRCGHIKKREQPAFLQVTHARVFRRNAYRREDVHLISFRCTCITFTPSLTGISSTRYPLERMLSMAFMVCSDIQHLYLSMLRKFLAPEMQSSQSFLRFSPILLETAWRCQQGRFRKDVYCHFSNHHSLCIGQPIHLPVGIFLPMLHPANIADGLALPIFRNTLHMNGIFFIVSP